MPYFASLDGPTPSAGLSGDRITYTHVSEVRVWNYLAPDGSVQQDLWLKIGEDYDGLALVHLKCSAVTSVHIGRACVLDELTLLATDDGRAEMRSGDDFHVVCKKISFVD